MAGWTNLVQAETLAIALQRADLVVVDCRFSLIDPNLGESAFRESHLPGAVYAHLDRDLSAPGQPGAGRHPWPRSEDFRARLEQWGIAPTTQVVAYDDEDGAYAARLWFLLRAYGHEKAAVLDGGWKRWISLGLPTQTQVARRLPTSYRGAFDRSRLLDADGVRAHLAAGGVLLDARAPERFRGEQEPLDRVAGHVPGAQPAVRRQPVDGPVQAAGAPGRGVPAAARRASGRRRRGDVRLWRDRVPPAAGDGPRRLARRAPVHRFVERLDQRSVEADRDRRLTTGFAVGRSLLR